MDAIAQTVTFTVDDIEMTAYLIEGEEQLRFTHRLMAEAIAMSKSSSQSFLQKQPIFRYRLKRSFLNAIFQFLYLQKQQRSLFGNTKRTKGMIWLKS